MSYEPKVGMKVRYVRDYVEPRFNRSLGSVFTITDIYTIIED